MGFIFNDVIGYSVVWGYVMLVILNSNVQKINKKKKR